MTVGVKGAITDNWPLAKSLVMDDTIRHSHYSTGFSTNTYSLGLAWQPIRDVRLRGTFTRAMRAPNMGLKPETAVTKSFGIQFTPGFLRNFSASIDYYDIRVSGIIRGIGANTVVNDCGSQNLFCDASTWAASAASMPA